MLFQTLTMLYGQDLASTRYDLGLPSAYIRTRCVSLLPSGPETLKHDVRLHQISDKSVYFSDRSTEHLEVTSTYLDWTTAFHSDGVFAISHTNHNSCPIVQTSTK